MRECQLCRRQFDRLAKSHIFPKGFFKNLPQKGRVDTIKLSGVKGRRLQNAIYDSSILCDECEHDIMAPLDDYGIKIIRDKKSAVRVGIPGGHEFALWVFDDVDRRRIRAFVASILWRASVSGELELKPVSIGRKFEERIRVDLIEEGGFDYVDMVLYYLTDLLHSAFCLPYSASLLPIDKARDRHAVNGWMLQFPNIAIGVSLDRWRHPHRVYWELDPSVSGQSSGLRVSTSLHRDLRDYKLMALEIRRYDYMTNLMRDAVHRSMLDK